MNRQLIVVLLVAAMMGAAHPAPAPRTVSTDSSGRRIIIHTGDEADSGSGDFDFSEGLSGDDSENDWDDSDDSEHTDGGSGTVKRSGYPKVGTFKCPQPYGHFPDPSDCHFFYQCSHNVPEVRRPCPKGLVFSPKIKNCIAGPHKLCDKLRISHQENDIYQ